MTARLGAFVAARQSRVLGPIAVRRRITSGGSAGKPTRPRPMDELTQSELGGDECVSALGVGPRRPCPADAILV